MTTDIVQNPLISAQIQMRKAYEHLMGKYDLEFEKILYPERVIEISIPVVMDSGNVNVYTGYRSQHCDARGVYKGGIRFHQDVSLDEVKALSIWMSIKGATLDLPLGGGKGGVILNPRDLSPRELEQVARGYVRGMYKYIGPDQDVPAPDVNTNGQIMAWMMDEYSRLVGKYSPGAFTGKPLEVAGSRGREAATGQGGLYALEMYLASQGDSLVGKKIIIQGAGNVGLHFMQLAQKKGAVIVGISDSRVGLYDPNGLDTERIFAMKKERKSLEEYRCTGGCITNRQLLIEAADILVPAALENQITEKNAGDIQTALILELANGPTTPLADDILAQRNIVVIPDILANAGGVTVSYFEQVQNNQNYYWKEEEIQERLKDKMQHAVDGVLGTAKKYQIPLRTAAYIIALERILSAMQFRAE